MDAVTKDRINCIHVFFWVRSISGAPTKIKAKFGKKVKYAVVIKPIAAME